jgi:iron complex transport system permease protein
MKKLGNLSTIGLIVILVISMIAILAYSTFTGAVSIPFDEVVRILMNKLFGYGDISEIRPATVAIVWQLYAPRGLLGLVIGAGLALVGIVMQAMVQNPLADPYILGISSGASLGATFAILMGSTVLMGTVFSSFGVELFAFLGAMVASIAVFMLSSMGGKITSTKLVLSGVIVASLCGAFSNLIVYMAPNATQMRDLTFWMMGSLSTTGFDTVLMCAVPLVICIVFFLTQLRNMNAMMLGDDTATTLGINLSTLRKIYIVTTAFLVAILVCNCGVIGFIGLIIPHIGRALVGTNHWRLFPITVLLGAIFMMVADILARSFTASEIPIGIITAICGAPVFAYIMITKSYGFGAGSK